MAEALLKVLVENLNSLIQKKIGSLLGVEKEMEKLSSMLSAICAVLEDAEERQLEEVAKLAQLLLNHMCMEEKKITKKLLGF